MARIWKIWLLTMLLTAASHASTQDAWTGFDETGFRLVISGESCFLHRGEEEPLRVPRDWLFPPEEVRAEADLLGYVTAFKWLPEVTAFPVGDGRVGLHLSSYAIQESGSARAAAGRDLFLIWDPAAEEPLRRGFEIKRSKGRIRLGGCMQSYHHRFYAGDVDCDRRLDLGVKEERTDCRAEGDTGPEYAHHHVGPLRWHPLTDAGWEYHEAFDRRLPCRGLRELPLPGLVMSPVDFALSLVESKPPLLADSRPSPLPPRYTFETEPARHDGGPGPSSRLVVRTVDGPREHTFPTGASIWRDESANGYLIINFMDRQFRGFATSGYDYVDLDSGRRSPVLCGLVYQARLVPKDLLVGVRFSPRFRPAHGRQRGKAEDTEAGDQRQDGAVVCLPDQASACDRDNHGKGTDHRGADTRDVTERLHRQRIHIPIQDPVAEEDEQKIAHERP